MEILHAYADLMKCEVESFAYHRSDKIRSFREAAKLSRSFRLKGWLTHT